MGNQNWKLVEDRICKRLGGRRVLGNRGSGVPDSDENVPWAVEVKAGYGRFQLPQAWLEQARRNQGERPWLLVQSPKHCRKPLVTMELDEFVRVARLAGLVPE